MTSKKAFIVSICCVVLALMLDFLYRNTSLLSMSTYRSMIEPLFFMSIPLSISSFFLLFLREEIFRAWLRFAYWWIPVSVFFIYLSSASSGGGFGMPNVFDEESVSLIFSALFLLISFILMLVKYIAIVDGKRK